MLLDDKARTFRGQDLVLTARLCSLGEVPLRSVFGELLLIPHKGYPRGCETISRAMVMLTPERGLWFWTDRYRAIAPHSASGRVVWRDEG